MMSLTEPSSVAEAFEHHFGDPRDERSLINHREMLALDEQDAFPERADAALNEWGLQRYYVPESCGGGLKSFEVLSGLARAVGRRDLTVAVAHAKTFLGGTPVWVAGRDALKAKVGAAIVSGSKVSLGLTEESHGSDLYSAETTAIETPNGYELTGAKWLINNATRGDALTTLARTDARGGPRGFSLFYVSKRECSGLSPLPRIRTHGVRGADISGIRFEGCLVPADARIGPTGHGLEIIMKALQVTRVLVPSISLGALDTALRHVLSFALSRRIGTQTVAQIPHARRILTEVFVELLAMEALVRVGARSAHVMPERLSVWSAVVKYLVPSRIDAAIHRLAVVLGARHYLRGSPFEKLLRDHALVALFDGSTVVNLSALSQELPRMALEQARRPADEDFSPRIATVYDFHQPLPEFRPERLDLIGRGGDEAPQALKLAHAEIELLSSEAIDPGLKLHLLSQLESLSSELADSSERFRSKERPVAHSPEVFIAAERHAVLHAATVCVLVWLRNRPAFGAFFSRGEWLALALHQLLGSRDASPNAEWYEHVFEHLTSLHQSDRLFALEPITMSPDAGQRT